MDGASSQPQKVGLKDKFSYSADHGGETIGTPDLQLNSQSVWDKDQLPLWFFKYSKAFESFAYCDDFSQGPKYFWTFGPDCDKYNAVKTVNMSRIDTIKFKGINNCINFTTGVIYFYTEVLNVMIIYGGVGGYLFGSAS